MLAAWAGTRLAMARTAEGLVRRRAQLWRGMAPTLAATPALAAFAGLPLDAVPVTDAADLRRDFAAWNTLGLSEDAARAAAEDAERGGPGMAAPGVTAGYSTGTQGACGVFLASAGERASYLGQSLAKLLPARSLVAGARIALVLRADSALYRDVARAGPFRFLYVPLALGAGERLAMLRAFGPDTLVAPAHVLAGIARAVEDGGPPLATLRRVFFGAEPMGDAERAWIAAVLGIRPDPIYQATEGFLGAACRHGTLHLNEDTLHVELEAVPGADAFRPVVTDLRRHSQPIVRVRLDDLLEPLPGCCPCGFAGRAVRPVMGRVTDLWRLPGRVVTPRLVTAAFEAALGPRADWVAWGSPAGLRAAVRDPASVDRAARVLHSLAAGTVPVAVRVCGAHDEGCREGGRHDWGCHDGGPKRRRVRWCGAP